MFCKQALLLYTILKISQATTCRIFPVFCRIFYKEVPDNARNPPPDLFRKKCNFFIFHLTTIGLCATMQELTDRVGNRIRSCCRAAMWRSRVVWSSAHDWKSCRPHKGLEGSNPSFSAIKSTVILIELRWTFLYSLFKALFLCDTEFDESEFKEKIML